MQINKLYRKIIIENYKNPFNKGLFFDKDKSSYLISEAQNNLCNESIKIQIFFDKEGISDIRYETNGCIILISSASLMSFFLKKINLDLCLLKINNFLKMIKNQKFDSQKIDKKLYVFKNISFFSSKISCVSMPWELTLKMIKDYKK
ncbi:iron-sulfur cluster assembly scaffold protein [Candidatus Phytoplasma sacchari]|uniref:Iron-sulfur cluster assembly scaffold protein n=1 Tax=Candidatus Phytoplasma sacchari TaxID=2609813 RepID=A0ABY7M2Y7_9MOLU|nr:iron-sulfur cluster assembly scaffold protein [Candidatus Phytoplasma sacchari]